MITLPLAALFGAFLTDRLGTPEHERKLSKWETGFEWRRGGWYRRRGGVAWRAKEIDVEEADYLALQTSAGILAAATEAHTKLEHLLEVVPEHLVGNVENLIEMSAEGLRKMRQLEGIMRGKILVKAGALQKVPLSRRTIPEEYLRRHFLPPAEE